MKSKLLCAVALVVMLFLVGCGGKSPPASSVHAPKTYQAKPRPAVPLGLAAPPTCSAATGQHFMGECLPHPTAQLPSRPTLTFGLTIQGGDTSNNDPILGVANWRVIARQSSFAIFKVSEGQTYFDRYAAPQNVAARAAGLVTGGYDFAHVCDNPVAEGEHFVADYKADGLLAVKTFHPWLDIEYGTTGCNTRNWLLTLISVVKRGTGLEPGIYTGAWFWNPAFGNWWPSPSIRAWVSGYGVRYPFMPGTRKQLDMWQWTDHYSVLGGAIDWSVWRDGAASFATYTNGPTPAPSKAQVARWKRARDASYKPFAGRNCTAHLARPDCFTFGYHRVIYFEHKIEAAQGRVPCFGPHARPKVHKCAVVRPYVSRWSHLRNYYHALGHPKISQHYATLVKQNLY